MKPTKGAWHCEWLDDTHGWVMVDGKYVAEMVFDDEMGNVPPADDQYDNSRVMALGPRLLEVLRSLMEAAEAGVAHQLECYNTAEEPHHKRWQAEKYGRMASAVGNANSLLKSLEERNVKSDEALEEALRIARGQEMLFGQPRYVVRSRVTGEVGVVDCLPYLGEWYTSDGIKHGS